MARKPKFDPERYDENPEWSEADFAKAKRASEMPDKMLSFFKATKVKPRKPVSGRNLSEVQDGDES